MRMAFYPLHYFSVPHSATSAPPSLALLSQASSCSHCSLCPSALSPYSYNVRQIVEFWGWLLFNKNKIILLYIFFSLLFILPYFVKYILWCEGTITLRPFSYWWVRTEFQFLATANKTALPGLYICPHQRPFSRQAKHQAPGCESHPSKGPH